MKVTIATENFFAAAEKDAVLQDQLKSALSAEDVVKVAADHGHTLDAVELATLQANAKEGRIGSLPNALRVSQSACHMSR